MTHSTQRVRCTVAGEGGLGLGAVALLLGNVLGVRVLFPPIRRAHELLTESALRAPQVALARSVASFIIT